MQNEDKNTPVANTVFTPTQQGEGASYQGASTPTAAASVSTQSVSQPVTPPPSQTATNSYEPPIVPDANSLESAPSESVVTSNPVASPPLGDPNSGASTATQPAQTPAAEPKTPLFPRRLGRNKAVYIITGVAMLIVIALVGVTGFISRRNIGQLKSPSSSVNEQSLTLGEDTGNVLSVLQSKGGKNKLIVNGDVVARGSLFIGTANGTVFGQFDASALTSDQVYTLPNSSGEICLSSDNCASSNSVPIQSQVATSTTQEDSVSSINGQVGDVSLTFGTGDNSQVIKLLQGTGITLTTNQSGNTVNIQISTTAFLQGGNKYGATAVLGTNDSNPLQIRTNGQTAATFAVGGAVTFKNAANSNQAFAVQNAAGVNLLTVNTTTGTVNTASLVPLTAGNLTTTFYNTTLSAVRDGQHDTILLDSSGLARIISFKPTAADLGFTKCNDTLCSSITQRTLQSTGSIGSHASAALDSSNNIHIVYYDSLNDQFKFLRCNSDCSTTTTPVVVMSGANNLTQRSARIAVGTDGMARMFLFNGANTSFTFVRCTATDCSTSVSTVINNSGGNNTGAPGIALASDNTARLTYHLQPGGLQYVQCTNANCTTSNTTTVDAASGSGDWNTIVLDNANLAHIAYQSSGVGRLTYINCLNAACSSKTTQTVDNTSDAQATSIVLNAKGVPQIAYYDTTPNTLKFASCDDKTCANPTISTVDSSANVGQYVSAAIGPDGYAQLAYYDASNQRLRFANLGSASDTVTGSNIGSPTAYYGTEYVRDIITDRFTLAPTTNSSTAFQVKNTAGSNVLTVDTTDKRVIIGAGTPSATLTVNSSSPNDSGSDGTDADPVLNVLGAKGGNTVGGTGQIGGAGSSISLQAGNGGDAPNGSTNGAGGNITFQAGTAGSGIGGLTGTDGNIYFKLADGAGGTTTYKFATAAGSGTYDICTTANNCNGSGGSGDINNGGNAFGSAITIGTNDNYDLNFETHNITRLTVTSSGDVNVNNDLTVGSQLAVGGNASISPNVLVQTKESYSNTSGAVTGIQDWITLSPPSDSTVFSTALDGSLGLTGSGINYSGVYTSTAGTTNVSTTGAVSTVIGTSGWARNNGAGSVTSEFGMLALSDNNASGTVTSAIGLGTLVSNTSSGTITNAAGQLVLSAVNSGGGTIGTNFGINVQPQTAGTVDYGIAVGTADTQTLWLSSDADNTTAAAGIGFGLSRDTNLYRSAAATLKTDGNFIVGSTLTVPTGTAVLGTASSTSGSLLLYNAAGAGSITLNAANPGPTAYTITLPAENGTVCTTGSVCSGYQASGNYFTQNGNAFSATAKLGTTDANSLQFITGNNTQVTIANGGATTFQNSTNSSAGFRILTSLGDNILTANTSNGSVLLGQASSSSGTLVFNNSSNSNTTTLSVVAATGARTINLPDESGTICIQNSTNCGFASSSGSGNYINNSTTVQSNANFAVQSSATGSITGLIKAKSSQTADLLQFQDSSGNAVSGVTASGNFYFGRASGATGSLTFYNSGGSGSISLSASNPGSSTYAISLPNASGTVCLTSGNCAGIGGTGDILNNGNSFGSDVILGTNDSNNFKFETNNVTQATIAVGGATTFQNSVDSASAFAVKRSDGASLLTIVTSGIVPGVALGNDTTPIKGILAFHDSTAGNGFIGSILGANTFTASRTFTLPDESGTICTTGSVCSGYQASGTYWAQGGNTLGASTPGVLGTLDNNTLAIKTNNITRLVFDTSNTAYFGLATAGALNPSSFTLTGEGSNTAGRAGTAIQLQAGSSTTGTSNTAGGDLILAGGQSTGNVAGGNIIFQYSAAGTSGTSVNSLATACTISGTNGSLSCPGAGSSSERFGSGATAAGNNTVVIGNSATSPSGNAVVIGTSATGSSSAGNVIIGTSASGGNCATCVILGSSAAASGTVNRNVILGGSASSAFSDTVVLGASAASTAANQLVVQLGQAASSTATSGYFGNGVTSATPAAFTLNATGSSSAGVTAAALSVQGGNAASGLSNTTGGALNLNGGVGTGTGNGGDVNIKIAAAGSTGSTQNAQSTVVTISGNNGSALFQNAANSTSAFRVDNASGADILKINTLTSGLNLFGNPNFEQNTSLVTAKGSATITDDDSLSNFGSRSLKIATTAAANDGATFNLAFPAGGTYSVSFYARVDSGSMTTAQIGLTSNGSDINCLTGQTLNTTWTLFTCSTLVAGANGTTVAGAYIKQSDATARNIFVDGVTIVSGATGLTYTAPAQNLQVGAFQNHITLNNQNTGETGPWEKNNNSLPASVYGNGSVVYNGYVYSVGGFTATANGSAATTAVYYAKINADGSTGSWTTASQSLPAARGEFGNPVVVNGFMYVVSGHAANNGSNQTTVYYAKINSDGSTGAWQSGNTSGLTAKSGHVVFTANGYIYSASGGAGALFYAKVNSDGSLGGNGSSATAWNTGTTVGGRANATVVVANNTAYIIGGGANNTIITTTLDPLTGANSNVQTLSTPTLPANRQYHSGAFVNGYVYVIGGSTTGSTNTNNTIYYAKLNGDGTLGTFQTSSYTLPQSLLGQASVADNGYIYSLGGASANASSGTVYSNIYYASTARVLVGGSLDLVGLSNQALSDASGSDPSGSIGGSLTAGNTHIVGSLDVQGSANFDRNVNIDGDLHVSTGATFKNSFAAAPQQIGSVAFASTIDTWVQGNYAYSITSAFLVPQDISDPANPVNLGSTALTGTATSIQVVGKYAYVATSTSLQIIDISNPKSPSIVSTTAHGGATSNGIWVQGHYAYISTGSGVVRIMDVSNPISPSVTSTWTPVASGNGEIFGQGKYIYYTSTTTNLYIADISNPYSVTTTGFINSSGTNGTTGTGIGAAVNAIFVKGSYAYLGESSGKFEIINVSDPTAPTLTKSVTTGSATNQAIWVQGNYAYLGGNTAATSFSVYDVTVPSNAFSVLSNANVGNAIQTIQVAGRYAYMNANGNLRIYDMGGAYIQQLSAGGIAASQLYTEGTITDAGDLSVQGAASFGQGLSAQGSSSFGGDGNKSGLAPLNVTQSSASATAGSLQGQVTTVNNTGVTTSGTDTTFGQVINVTRTGATGGTANTYGVYSNVSADNAGAGTSNAYNYYAAMSLTTADNAYGYGVGGSIGGSGTMASYTGFSNNVSNLGISGSTTTNMYGFHNTVSLSGSGGCSGLCSGLTVSNIYGIQLDAPTIDGAPVVTNNYGINIDGLTSGATNYGIKVGASNSGSGTNYGIAIGTARTQTLWVGSDADNTSAAAGLAFGSSRDTNLYRSAADTLKTDDAFAVGTDFSISSAGNITTNASGISSTGGAWVAGVYLGVGSSRADAGAVRLQNNNNIAWRNAANNGNVTLGVNASNVFAFTNAATSGSAVAQFNNAGAETCTISPGAGTQFACSSDARLKGNVVTIANGLDVIKQLRGVNFTWNDDPTQKNQEGFIAQELMQILPQAVSQDSNGYYVANYQAIIPYLVGAAQTQDLQITGLQQGQTTSNNSVSNLTGQISDLSQRVSALENNQGNTNFASLNVSGTATVHNLTVTGAATIAQLTVTGNATFAGNITIQGHLLGNTDTRGTLTIPAGQTQLKFTFVKPYDLGSEPVVILTPKDTFAPRYRVDSTDKDFTIYFETPASTDVIMNYQVQQ